VTPNFLTIVYDLLADKTGTLPKDYDEGAIQHNRYVAVIQQQAKGVGLVVRSAAHLFWEAEYREQDLPSQAQYGSLARQQSAQASPYTSHRWRASWVSPVAEDTYSCCCCGRRRGMGKNMVLYTR